MARGTKSRWAIFVHDPDGDSGCGRIVGPFLDANKADERAEKIRAKSEAGIYTPDLECIVLPVMPSGSGIATVIGEVC